MFIRSTDFIWGMLMSISPHQSKLICRLITFISYLMISIIIISLFKPSGRFIYPAGTALLQLDAREWQVIGLNVALFVFHPSVIYPRSYQPEWLSPDSPPFKPGSFLWRGRRFLRRAAPLTLLRARPTWRGEAASPLLLARSFLPRVQWAPCGPTPSLFRAVYLFNVGFYSRRERNGENNNSQKIGYSRLSPSETSFDEGSGLRDGNVPLQKHRVRFFCECKGTCYL